jgi:YhcH/YjgK/YiaL family protein
MIFDSLKNSGKYLTVHPLFAAAFEFIGKAINEDLPIGKYEIDGNNIFASVQEYEAKPKENCRYEGHRKYIDIQCILSGMEAMEVMDIGSAKPSGAFNEMHDVGFYENSDTCVSAVLGCGQYGIFFPHDIHRPGMRVGDSGAVKKVVVKIKV